MTDDRTNADRAVHAAVTALQGLTASIDKAWDEAIGKRQPPGVRGGFYSAAWLDRTEGHQLFAVEGTLAERRSDGLSAPESSDVDAGGTSANPSGSLDCRIPRSASVSTESEPEPRRSVGTRTIPAASQRPPSGSETIRDLTEDLSFTHDELRDLWKEPPAVSRARRYEAMGIVHEQAARLCRKLAGAWEVEEGRRA